MWRTRGPLASPRGAGDHEVNNGERWSWILLLDCSLNYYSCVYIRLSGNPILYWYRTSTTHRHQTTPTPSPSPTQLNSTQFNSAQPDPTQQQYQPNPQPNIIMDSTTQNKRTSTDNRRPVCPSIHSSIHSSSRYSKRIISNNPLQ
jgi:hypothetical protein